MGRLCEARVGGTDIMVQEIIDGTSSRRRQLKHQGGCDRNLRFASSSFLTPAPLCPHVPTLCLLVQHRLGIPLLGAFPPPELPT